MMYMLDTDMCVYLINRKPAGAIRRLTRTAIEEVCISAITLSELEYGVSKSSRPDENKLALAEFLAPIQVAPYDDMAAQEYGRLRARLGKQGAPIGSLDTLIAAHALALGCALVTNNEAEFKRVPGLRIQNWAK
ncbi:MAG: type II toxin-antitoxin system VapC family toxin [Candidatus Sumerlaeota bacterium]|nr:type II toxin-antitoxin system VapC family toxin [Candidatus Sumerlaeota bacterium]